MKHKKDELTALDLFSGAGGLSLGLKNAGFRVVAGVEIDKAAIKTYKANHPKTKVLETDIRKVTGAEILKAAGVNHINLIAGCPPCQGFSTLTAKYHRTDPRDDLALEMARIVVELKPEMVMMENVPGLAKRGKPVLDEFIQMLEAEGYQVNYAVLQLANYGIPQTRRRFVLLAGKGFEIPIPQPTHAKAPTKDDELTPWLTTRDILTRIGKPLTLAEAQQLGGPKKHGWHIIGNVKAITLKRIKAVKPGKSRAALPKRLRPKCHKRSNEGFQNVYARMSWNQTPPTITGGCTSFCKGRFGHPKENRTISVREAALIQTFPPDYIFDTTFISSACDQIGNALPPKFAWLVAEQCLSSLDQTLRNKT